MRVLFFIILVLTIQGCATKKDTKKQLLPQGIKSVSQEIYLVVNGQKKLQQKKQLVFTRNGRIKYSKTTDSLGYLLQETRKKLWFIVKSYPNKEPCYCKTRWKPKQRERISCYTKKQYKQNEAIYHYNTDGTIKKIVDNFSSFDTQYFFYANKELSKLVIRDKKDNLIDEFLIYCTIKDEKGTCLKEIRISTKTNDMQEILLSPRYN